MPESKQQEDPPPTLIDRDCAFFVRDALFPLRRDWGSKSSRGRSHHQIHPALMALDRLRTDLIDLRPGSTSYSNIFPRGVVLVTQSDALVGSSSNNNNSNSNASSKTMEYNGQPDIDEPTASVEIIPNLLTVKCMRCNDLPFFPGSNNLASKAKAYVREKYKPWKNPEDDDYESSREHELVVCSDRILQKDYYKQFGNNSERQQQQQQRREDLPVRSMGAVEEALAREITKIQVQSDGSTDNSNSNSNSSTDKAKPPMSYQTFPSSGNGDGKDAQASCEAFAGLELLAARAAECLLVSKRNDVDNKATFLQTTETRMGSALVPRFLFPVLPRSVQGNFVDRCALKVATQHTVAAAAAANEADTATAPNSSTSARSSQIRPRECVQNAWAATRNTNISQ